MAIFGSDTLTNTAGTTLQAHTASDGGTWAKHPVSAVDAIFSDANRIRVSSNSFAGYTHSGTPANADYDVEATIIQRSTANAVAGVKGRSDTTARTHYMWRYNNATVRWELYILNAGSATLIGSFSETLTIDQSYTIKLEMRGTTIKGYVDGVERASVTNSTITAAGKAGVWVEGNTGNTAGLHLDNFVATDTSGGAIPQFARPDADTAAGTWTTAPLFSKIDETTASEADIISSTTTSGSTCTIGLGNVTDPAVSTGHIVRYRYSKSATGGSSPSITVELLQGATVRASSGAVAVADSTAYTTGTLTLTGTEADAITDYTDLHLRLTMTRAGGAARGINVSWAEMEVPEAVPTEPPIVGTARAGVVATAALVIAPTAAGSASARTLATAAVTGTPLIVGATRAGVVAGTVAIAAPAPTVSGAAAVRTLTSAELAAVQVITGAATFAATAIADIVPQVEVALVAGTASIDVAATGAIAVSPRIAATATAHSSATGAITLTPRLIGTAAILAASAGSVATGHRIAGSASSRTIASADAVTITVLTGTATIGVSATANIQPADAPATVAGSAGIRAVASAAISTDRNFTGTATARLNAAASISTAPGINGTAALTVDALLTMMAAQIVAGSVGIVTDAEAAMLARFLLSGTATFGVDATAAIVPFVPGIDLPLLTATIRQTDRLTGAITQPEKLTATIAQTDRLTATIERT